MLQVKGIDQSRASLFPVIRLPSLHRGLPGLAVAHRYDHAVTGASPQVAHVICAAIMAIGMMLLLAPPWLRHLGCAGEDALEMDFDNG
jgi:hypothetical protein